MKFEFLKYFTVLAEELHYGRAAARLSITQPPLSTAIKTLESEVGVMLFSRNRKLVELTPAGAEFLKEASRILDRYAHAKTVAKAVEQGVIGRLDIGFGVTLTYRGILDLVEQFRQEMPEIEIVMHEMPGLKQYDRLMRGEIDAGFSIGQTAPPILRSIALERDHLVLCVPANHAMANRRHIDLQEIKGEPFVMLSRESNPTNYEMITAMFRQAGIQPVLKHSTVNWMTSMVMVAQGRGLVSLVPSTMARAPVRGVTLIPLKGEQTMIPGLLAWNPAHASAALLKFIESARRTLHANQSVASRPEPNGSPKTTRNA